MFVLMSRVVRNTENDTSKKLREDCQLNLEKLKQKVEGDLLKPPLQQVCLYLYFICGSTDLLISKQILAHVQGCCEDPNWLWDEEVQEKECSDVK